MQNPLSDDDCSVLLHLLAVAEAWVDAEPDGPLARQVHEGLAAHGLLAADEQARGIGPAIAQLQVRYRFSLGEYTERATGERCVPTEPSSCETRSGIPTGE